MTSRSLKSLNGPRLCFPKTSGDLVVLTGVMREASYWAGKLKEET